MYNIHVHLCLDKRLIRLSCTVMCPSGFQLISYMRVVKGIFVICKWPSLFSWNVKCLYHLSTSCSTCSKKQSEQEHEEGWLPCHGHTILLITVKTNRRQDQNHGSRPKKYFFFISRRIILENHGSWLLMKSWLTRKKGSHFTFQEKQTRPFTNNENTLYHPHVRDNWNPDGAHNCATQPN